MAESVSFHVHESFAFKIGSKNLDAIVPRMRFITGGKVIQKIAEIQGKDLGSAVSLLVKVKNGEQVAGDGIEGVVSKLIKEKNFDIILTLLEMVTEKTITEKIIIEADCQFDEAVKILAYLLDGNFSSLKNLSASLQAITGNGR